MRYYDSCQQTFEIKNIEFTEQEFLKAYLQGNVEYSNYLQKKLGVLYKSYMKTYAGQPDRQLSNNKKQTACY